MTRPLPSSKLVLLEDRRGGSPSAAGAKVRRYRLARLRLGQASAGDEARFEHLRRAHD